MTDPACRELAAAVVVKTIRDLESYEALASKTVKKEARALTERYGRDAVTCLKTGGLDPYMEILGFSPRALLSECERLFPNVMRERERGSTC